MEPRPPHAYQDFMQRYPKTAQAWEMLALAGAEGPADPKHCRLPKLAITIGAQREGAIRANVRKALAMGITRQEIEQIRGVDCAGALKTLMERRLVKVVGKKDVPGKPFLFGTTREFMEVFSLGSLNELPSMREIEEFLAASTASPVEAPRPGFHLPTVPEGGVEQGGDELAASLGEAAPGAEGARTEGTIPSAVTGAGLVDAASKEAGETGEPPDGD